MLYVARLDLLDECFWNCASEVNEHSVKICVNYYMLKMIWEIVKSSMPRISVKIKKNCEMFVHKKSLKSTIVRNKIFKI